MTHDELVQLQQLVTRYATEELDQHETWHIQTAHGPVRVLFTREAQPVLAPPNLDVHWGQASESLDDDRA